MGNFVKNQEVIQKNQEEVSQSQVQESPNILIKQSKIGNVEIIKLNMQIVEVDVIYESVDKIQIDLTYSSQVNCQINVYTFITEIKGSKQQRFERTMQECTIQKFKCPQGLNHQFPSKYIEFMITDLLKFNRIKATSDVQHHTLIIEMRSLTQKSLQMIYFYKIDCNEQNFQCELINTKQIIVHKSRMYEIHELYGVKNTPFSPEWNPNTIEDKECVICFCNMINTVLLPCKHMCTCSVCADHILMNQKVKQCPLCRIDIDNYLTLEIKDKVKQDLQLRQFQEGQQKYLEAYKEKKDQQAIKQSFIMDQLKSKVHQDQMRKLKMFNDIEEFQNDNQNNQDLYNNDICYSNEENHSDNGNNQIQGSFHNKIKQQYSEEDNNLKDDKQRYSSKQRVSSYDLKQERGILSSFQHSQEKQNDQQQGSDESEISQELPQFSSKQQQGQYSFDYLNYDEQPHYNCLQHQTNSEKQQQVLKQTNQFIQGTDKALPTIPEYIKESSDVFLQMGNIDKEDIVNQFNVEYQQNQSQLKILREQSQTQSQDLKLFQQQQQQLLLQEQIQSHKSLMKQKNQQVQFIQSQQNFIEQDDALSNQFELNEKIQQYKAENIINRVFESQNKQIQKEFVEDLFPQSIQKNEQIQNYKIPILEVQLEQEDNNDSISQAQKNFNQQQIQNKESTSQKEIQKTPKEKDELNQQVYKSDQISLIVFD